MTVELGHAGLEALRALHSLQTKGRAPTRKSEIIAQAAVLRGTDQFLDPVFQAHIWNGIDDLTDEGLVVATKDEPGYWLNQPYALCPDQADVIDELLGLTPPDKYPDGERLRVSLLTKESPF